MKFRGTHIAERNNILGSKNSYWNCRGIEKDKEKKEPWIKKKKNLWKIISLFFILFEVFIIILFPLMSLFKDPFMFDDKSKNYIPWSARDIHFSAEGNVAVGHRITMLLETFGSAKEPAAPTATEVSPKANPTPPRPPEPVQKQPEDLVGVTTPLKLTLKPNWPGFGARSEGGPLPPK